MAEKNYTGLIPENIKGRAITAEATTDLKTIEAAKALYACAKDRLLNINSWHRISGALTAGFQLTDKSGNEQATPPKPGNFIRIDVPGPGSSAGEGFDWVVVEDVKEVKMDDVESIAILVHPATNPCTGSEHIAHFYSPESSSTFSVTREGTTVSAAVYDRNIEANEETKHPVDKLRNAVVGLGAKHGLSKLQWQALVDSLVKTDPEIQHQ